MALLSGCSLPPVLDDTPMAALSPVATLAPMPIGTPQFESAQPPGLVTPQAIEAPPPAPAALPCYTVQSGDTLLGIAMEYHVSIAGIQLVNDLGDSTAIQAGQVLTIPLPLQEGESPYWSVHIVQSGESLSKIARAYDVTVDDLLRVNSVADPALIAVGQRLVIPLEALAVAQAPASTDVPTVPPTVQPRPTNTSLPAPVAETATPAPVASATFTPQPQPTVPVEVSGWAGQVVELINQKRIAAGLPALSIAPELMRAAQAHADDCAQRGWGSHVGSDGASTQVRFQRAGYDGTAWGENWVQALDPVKAVDWWYNETPPNDPHRKNILSTRYSEIGVGIAPAEYGYYFIADFGRR